ncbi:MAG: UDP-N-acetylmuramoyl-L-alanyl-D-glutamate--2,6-diaminopimelate ligase [Chlamydiales bacterium]|nr:UDP-N-acetylmuramoyl-L-alanyl-D-glutamate--2,6-diaminopimelate ligase [Chlamydiales bacterium]
MKLKKLIEHLPIKIYKGSKEVEITGLCSHSKYVAPGNLFIVKLGTRDDGAKYVNEALASGAAAILTDLPDPSLRDVVQLITPDVVGIEGQLASRFFGDPSRSLFTVGVTGTNGKTTVSYLVKHLLDALGGRCGLIGTIEYMIGDYHFEAELTTPDVLTNNKLLSEMVRQGSTAAAMEVSSHALSQNRVDGIHYDVAIFTNLSQDHLDYHGTLQAYAAAKKRLFTSLDASSTAITTLKGMEMVEECKGKVFTYSLLPKADLYATDLHFTPEYTAFVAHHNGKSSAIKMPLVGDFNVLNALAAIATCIVKGHPLEEIAPHFSTFPQVRGRFERVAPNIYIDFAHTPDAIANVLSSLEHIRKGRILLVFGAGGDRDRQKRKEMGRVASAADLTILTSDNPRSEDPRAICDEVASGCTGEYMIEIDRRKAIEMAIALAAPDDLILIAGKGHETHQTFAHQTIPFDDRKVVLETLDEVRCS